MRETEYVEKVIFFPPVGKTLHCKYLLANDIHSRIFACTVFSFIALHVCHTRFWTLKYFLSNHPVVVEAQSEQPFRKVLMWFRGRRLEIYSACKTALLGYFATPASHRDAAVLR